MFSLTSMASANNDKYDIFIEGCHLDEPIPNGNEWYGIYKHIKNGKIIYKLSKAKLETTKIFANVDDLYNFCVKSNSLKNTKKVPTDNAILLKSNNLKPEIIETVISTKLYFNELKGKPFIQGKIIPKTEESIKITLGEKSYVLHQTTNLDDYSKGPNHTLTLTHNNISQVLYNKRGNYEGATDFYIIWAGDIDGDKKLDMIVNLPETYASPYHLRLYLSSYAKSGNHISQVAERGFPSP